MQGPWAGSLADVRIEIRRILRGSSAFARKNQKIRVAYVNPLKMFLNSTASVSPARVVWNDAFAVPCPSTFTPSSRPRRWPKRRSHRSSRRPTEALLLQAHPARSLSQQQLQRVKRVRRPTRGRRPNLPRMANMLRKTPLRKTLKRHKMLCQTLSKTQKKWSCSC